jgi:hypothetical protein
VLLYTTYSSLMPESYSSNVRVGNLQLPNCLRSSEGMDRLHRPEKKNVTTYSNVRIEVLCTFL